MSNQVYALALKSTLQEIQNVCPDITSNFIFKNEKILAKDQNMEEETATQTMDAFNKITETADIIGGLEAVTIQGVEGKVNIAAMNVIEHDDRTTTIHLTLETKGLSQLSRLLNRIGGISGVHSINRVGDEATTKPKQGD